MTNTCTKHIIIVCRQPPYGSSLSKEALDFSLAAGIFDQTVSVIFIGDGVWQLLDQQRSDLIAMKNQQKMLTALPLYGIDSLYVDQQALSARNIDEKRLVIAAKLLHDNAIKELLGSADVIINF